MALVDAFDPFQWLKLISLASNRPALLQAQIQLNVVVKYLTLLQCFFILEEDIVPNPATMATLSPVSFFNIWTVISLFVLFSVEQTRDATLEFSKCLGHLPWMAYADVQTASRDVTPTLESLADIQRIVSRMGDALVRMICADALQKQLVILVMFATSDKTLYSAPVLWTAFVIALLHSMICVQSATMRIRLCRTVIDLVKEHQLRHSATNDRPVSIRIPPVTTELDEKAIALTPSPTTPTALVARHDEAPPPTAGGGARRHVPMRVRALWRPLLILLFLRSTLTFVYSALVLGAMIPGFIALLAVSSSHGVSTWVFHVIFVVSTFLTFLNLVASLYYEGFCQRGIRRRDNSRRPPAPSPADHSPE